MDETWISHYTLGPKKQSTQCLEADSSAPRKAKTVPSAGKIMASVFSDANGTLFFDYLKKNYPRNLLEMWVRKFFKKNLAYIEIKKKYHQVDPPAHKSVLIVGKKN